MFLRDKFCFRNITIIPCIKEMMMKMMMIMMMMMMIIIIIISMLEDPAGAEGEIKN